MLAMGIDYKLDIVMCIDATKSMSYFLRNFGESAITFYQKYVEEMEINGIEYSQLRIKVVVFRDFYSKEPLAESRFFVMEKEADAFCDYVKNIQSEGGAFGKACSLEALSLALKSDWVKDGQKRRHIVVVFSDSKPYALGEKSDSPLYPEGIPSSFEELTKVWDEMDGKSKRLIVMAPECEPWADKMVEWVNCFYSPVEENNGLNGEDLETCVKLLAHL